MSSIGQQSGTWTRRRILTGAGGSLVAAHLASRSWPSQSSSTGEGNEWHQFQYDKENTGYAPDNSGPSVPVERSWEKTFRSEETENPTTATSVVIGDGTVLTAEFYGSKIRGFNAETGEQTFQQEVAGKTVGTPAVAGGYVFVGTDKISTGRPASVLKISLDTGDVVHSRELEGVASTPITVGTESLFVGDTTGRIYRLSTGELARQWDTEITSENQLWANTVAVRNRVAIIPDRQGVVRAVFQSDGELAWEFDLQKEISPNRRYTYKIAPTIRGSNVYLPTREGKIEILELLSGERINTLDINKHVEQGVGFDNSLVVTEDLIFGGSDNGLDQAVVFALSSQSGAVEWTFTQFPETVTNFSPPVVADDSLYIASNEYIYAIDAETGDLEWRHLIAGTATAPAAAQDAVYISAGATLHAFVQESTTPTEINESDSPTKSPTETKTDSPTKSPTKTPGNGDDDDSSNLLVGGMIGLPAGFFLGNTEKQEIKNKTWQLLLSSVAGGSLFGGLNRFAGLENEAILLVAGVSFGVFTGMIVGILLRENGYALSGSE